jgi:hypothetical protein
MMSRKFYEDLQFDVVKIVFREGMDRKKSGQRCSSNTPSTIKIQKIGPVTSV